MKRLLPCLLSLLCLQFVYGAETSPELERLQNEIAPYLVPTRKGDQIIPKLALENATVDRFVSVLSNYGVQAMVSKSVRDHTINIALRNLSINQCLRFTTQQAGLQWIYRRGFVIIFQSDKELKPNYRKDYAEKVRIEGLILAENRRLSIASAKEQRAALNQIMVDSVEIDSESLISILQLFKGSSEAPPLAGKPLNCIPLFNPKEWNPTGSFSFQNQSVQQMLDTMGEEMGFTWEARGPAIVIQKK